MQNINSGKLKAKFISEVQFSISCFHFHLNLILSYTLWCLGFSQSPSQQPCLVKICLFFSSSQLHKNTCYSGKQRFCPWPFAVLWNAWYSLLQWRNCRHTFTEESLTDRKIKEFPGKIKKINLCLERGR